MDFAKLFERDGKAKKDGAVYKLKREIFEDIIKEKGRHFIGIAGPRGAGKTILLKQMAAISPKEAFYISADTIAADADIFELVSKISESAKYKLILLDEAHFNRNIAGALKNLYDFSDLKIIFTSSISLAVHNWKYDLARRMKLIPMRLFSFREFIKFKTEQDIPELSLTNLCEREWTSVHLSSGRLFDEYIRGGILPFALEEPEPLPLLKNVLEKVIYHDIPAISRLMTHEMALIEKLVEFIGKSAVDDINYTSLSKNIGISKYKAEQYVTLLEKAFIINRILPAGTNVLREPKILLTPPFRLLYREWQDCIGGLREDFFAESMHNAEYKISYLKGSKGQKTPDYCIDNQQDKYVFEIGGKGKGREQFKGITTDKKLVMAHTMLPDAGQIPLYMSGFLKKSSTP